MLLLTFTMGDAMQPSLWSPDCCDGTDEQQGCKNTCKQAGSAARQELASKTKEYAAGAKTRQKYISQFQTSRQTWQQDLDKVNKDLGPQQELADKAKGLVFSSLCRIVLSPSLH